MAAFQTAVYEMAWHQNGRLQIDGSKTAARKRPSSYRLKKVCRLWDAYNFPKLFTLRK